MHYFVVICALALAGCGGAPNRPLIDYTDKEPTKVNADLVACEQERRQVSFNLGPFLSQCMERKGYTVVDRSS